MSRRRLPTEGTSAPSRHRPPDDLLDLVDPGETHAGLLGGDYPAAKRVLAAALARRVDSTLTRELLP